MHEALREPGVRAVVQAIGGACLVLSGLIALLPPQSPFRLVVASLVVAGGLVVVVSGIRAYGRQRSGDQPAPP